MSTLSEYTANALRDALGAEHASLWVYGLTSAFASESRVRPAISEAMNTHRAQRDSAERLIRDAGMKPPVAQPAYSLPQPVTDQNSAIRALITAETECQIGWRSVLENTQDAGLRRTALDALTASATRATRWRVTVGEPGVTAFPGSP